MGSRFRGSRVKGPRFKVSGFGVQGSKVPGLSPVAGLKSGQFNRERNFKIANIES